MTKKYKVTLYPSDSDVPVAEAYVDAADFETAHKRAISQPTTCARLAQRLEGHTDLLSPQGRNVRLLG